MSFSSYHLKKNVLFTENQVIAFHGYPFGEVRTKPQTGPQTEPQTEPQTRPQTKPQTEPQTEPQIIRLYNSSRSFVSIQIFRETD